MRSLLVRIIPAALTAFLITGCISQRKPLPTPVAVVDLERYMGRWYVISHVPYFLEKGKVASYDTYARRPDGRLTNNFTFREKTLGAPEKTWNGVARVVDPVSNATWKVSFVWPISITYKILLLDPDYKWAVVGTNDGGLLWVLARERRLPAATYAAIVTELNARGLTTEKLALVPHPET